MGYMLRADPYQDKPLEDLADDITDEMVAAMASHPNNFGRGGQGGARMPMPEIELPPSSGKWAAIFAQEVNNALEQRDASLTLLAVCYSLAQLFCIARIASISHIFRNTQYSKSSL